MLCVIHISQARLTEPGKQITTLRDLLDSHDKNGPRRLNEYGQSFWNKAFSLNRYDTSSDSGYLLVQKTAPPKGLWDEYDYVLQQSERWRRLVNVDSRESEAVIDRARQHVNQLGLSSIAFHLITNLLQAGLFNYLPLPGAISNDFS